MNITLQLQKLDDLIVEHTQPPVQAILRNRLHPLLEQLEAHVLALKKKSRSDTGRISELEKQNAQLKHDHEREISNLFLLEAHKQNRGI